MIADIHGEYELFTELLQKIELTTEDTLFLLGDSIDRGKDGLKLLKHTMLESNIVPIIGNHEYMALRCLEWLHSNSTEKSVKELKKKPELLQAFSEWMNR